MEGTHVTGGHEPGAWTVYDADELPPVLQAALACFAEQGYHGTSIRRIAQRAGLSVPGLYHHYASKRSMLVEVLAYGMEDLWWRSEAAARESGPDPVAQLTAQVTCFVEFHARRQALAFVAWSEIRSLTGDDLAAHLARRDRQQRVFDAIVERGVAQGVFGTPYPLEASRAVVTMCTGVSQWYRSTGDLTPDEVAARFCRFALGTVA